MGVTTDRSTESLVRGFIVVLLLTAGLLITIVRNS